MYDVIIVGASFAGLAVANQLREHRVLLIDRKPVGSGQTSACGTILKVLQQMDLTESVLQTHDHLTVHTAGRTFEFQSPYLWCTFDYQHLCEILLERSGADFLQAAVQTYDNGLVCSSQGALQARCVVDASGWRAVLASSIIPGFNRATPMNFGIESIQSLKEKVDLDQTGLHFWYDADVIRNGVGWVFPRGETVSIGLGSYAGATHLRHPLERFSARFDSHLDGLHGTYFPYNLRAPTVEQVFVVGDAAGMCLGLTGEGIRPALFFGEACGKIVRRVLEGELTLDAGLAEYRAFVKARHGFFKLFSSLQLMLNKMPALWIDSLASAIHQDNLRTWVLEKYWGLTREWDEINIHPV